MQPPWVYFFAELGIRPTSLLYLAHKPGIEDRGWRQTGREESEEIQGHGASSPPDLTHRQATPPTGKDLVGSLRGDFTPPSWDLETPFPPGKQEGWERAFNSKHCI